VTASEEGCPEQAGAAGQESAAIHGLALFGQVRFGQDAFEQGVQGLLRLRAHLGVGALGDGLLLEFDRFLALTLEPADAGQGIELVGLFALGQFNRPGGTQVGEL